MANVARATDSGVLIGVSGGRLRFLDEERGAHDDDDGAVEDRIGVSSNNQLYRCKRSVGALQCSGRMPGRALMV